VILCLVLAIGFGILALIGQFKQAHTAHKVNTDEQCQAQLFRDNLNRNQVLARLEDEERAAQYALEARWARDVFLLQHGHPEAGNDIPAAYDVLRARVAAINKERAEQGALISGSTPPPGCRLPLTSTVGSTPPSVSIPSARLTAHPSVTRTVTLLPALPGLVTIRVTETVFIRGRSIFINGPTITVARRPPPVTKTRTVTVTAHPTRTH